MSSSFLSYHSFRPRKHLSPRKKINFNALPDSDEEHDDSVQTKENEPSKSLSPLAMAAADWLEGEDDEFDELSSYWEKYDNSKRQKKDEDNRTKKKEPSSATVNSYTPKVDFYSSSSFNDKVVSDDSHTRELLNEYYETIGIDKTLELKHYDEIERAWKACNDVKCSTSDAIRILERIRPYLQCNSKMGGKVLLRLANAYHDKDGYYEDGKVEKGRRGMSDARDICLSLLKNPDRDVRRGVRQLLSKLERQGDDGRRGKRPFFGDGNWFQFWDDW